MKAFFSHLLGSSKAAKFNARESRSAFTLIELLVVVTIMATLLALLGGGIRKSIDNARRRQRATDLKTLSSAILTYWHDTGKPPIEEKTLKAGVQKYYFGAENDGEDKKSHTITRKDNGEIFQKLVADSSGNTDNELNKAYLDLHQLRTAKNITKKVIGKQDGLDVWDIQGTVSHMTKPGENVADFKGGYYRVTIDMVGKSCKVQYWDVTKKGSNNGKDCYGAWSN